MGIVRIIQGVVAATQVAGPPPPPPPPPPSYGSWTIEWWSKKLSPQTNTIPRIFAVGIDTGASIGYSNESGGDYIWTGTTGNGPITVGTTTNTWIHWAIVSDGTDLTFYKNGVSIFTAARTGSTITDDTTSLYIGSDSSSFWKGLITDFHILKGTAKYTGNFTPPSSRIQSQTGTQVLLYAASGSSITDAGALSGTASNWTYSTDDPYSDGYGSIQFNGTDSSVVYNGSAGFALDVA